MARDDYDDRPRGSAELAGLDKFFANTPVAIILAVVLFFCCWPAGAILGGIGVATCKNPDSKRNAMIMLGLAALALVISVIYYAVAGAAAFQFGK